MVSAPQRAEVWWGELPDVGRRPFLIMTRNAAIPVLNAVLAAPVSRTVRGIPTEVRLGPEDGMPVECAAGMDNVRAVSKAHLVERACVLSPARMAQACSALRSAVDC